MMSRHTILAAVLWAVAACLPAQTVTVDNNTPSSFTSTLGVGVPIIMYHGLDAEHGYNPADYVAQMDYLANNGFQTITLDHLKSWIQTGSPALPAKPIVLTYDDNYLSIYTVAYPAMGARGFIGYNFAHTNYVGVAPGGSPATSYDHADWVEINEMESSGVVITESHTLNHVNLVSSANRTNEIVQSKAAIEANMPGKTCRHFSYPFGAYNATVLSITQTAGYETAVSTLTGVNTRSTPLFELRRYGVNPNTAMSTFQTYANAGLTGGVWTSSTSQPGYIGSNYQYATAGGGEAVATWTFVVPITGPYQVSARWTTAGNRATNAPYTVDHSAGSSTVQVNQQANGGVWNLLGQYNFLANVPYTVTLTNNANGIVVADGVQFSAVTGVSDWELY